jgi:hypothetical protein
LDYDTCDASCNPSLYSWECALISRAARPISRPNAGGGGGGGTTVFLLRLHLQSNPYLVSPGGSCLRKKSDSALPNANIEDKLFKMSIVLRYRTRNDAKRTGMSFRAVFMDAVKSNTHAHHKRDDGIGLLSPAGWT